MIFIQMTIFDLENVLKSSELEKGPKLMIVTVQNRQNYAVKAYHFYLVRVETPVLLYSEFMGSYWLCMYYTRNDILSNGLTFQTIRTDNETHDRNVVHKQEICLS